MRKRDMDAMDTNEKKERGRPLGIGMLSGGLDSALAVRVIQEAGADVVCLHFFTGFCITGHHSRVGRTDKPVANTALQVAAELGVPVELCDISGEYLDIVLHPRYGYGANVNPCIDCRIFMLRKAREYMVRHSGEFVFTGEVVGQRPMSQMRQTLDVVEKNAGLEGRLVRPLSARLLPPTIPEREGRIDRARLLDLQGRSRKSQIERAKQYGISSYSQPGGGCCFLTDEAYARKFRDMLAHGSADGLTMDDIVLLGVGRHFRLSPRVKLILGRDEIENTFLARYAVGCWTVQVKEHPGPLGLVLGEIEPDLWTAIGSLTARFSDGKREERLAVEFSRNGDVKDLEVSPATSEFADAYRI
jgi:tRNA-specific 2-thiouridylase